MPPVGLSLNVRVLVPLPNTYAGWSASVSLCLRARCPMVVVLALGALATGVLASVATEIPQHTVHHGDERENEVELIPRHELPPGQVAAMLKVIRSIPEGYQTAVSDARSGE